MYYTIYYILTSSSGSLPPSPPLPPCLPPFPPFPPSLPPLLLPSSPLALHSSIRCSLRRAEPLWRRPL